MNGRLLFPAIVAAALAAACVGEIVTPDDGSGEGAKPGTNAPGAQPAVCGGGVCVQASHLSRLTRTQYVNSVRQLLGPNVPVDADYLPHDQLAAATFKSTELVPVSDDDVDAYSVVAETLAAAAPLAELLPCSVADGDRDCATSFIDELVPRAYRRPIDAEERQQYLDLYDWALAEGDSFEDGVRLVVATALQSPHFLYRLEQGGVDAPRLLSGREVAVRLAYFLWREAPDAALLAAAEAGELDGADGVEAHARSMIVDPRFDRALREFHRDWLGIEDVAGTPRDPERFPEFTSELAASMLEETERFALDVFENGDARQETLLSASYSIIDADLAKLYGVPAPQSSGFSKVELPGRSGVLTHASVLTTFSSGGYTTPIFRGIFVRKRMLCQELKPRPENVDEAIAALEEQLQGELDDRERLTALTGSGECIGCHALTNPIGFAFDAFDGIGKHRDADYSGALLDTSGGLESGGDPDYQTDVDGSYTGAAEISEALASSESVAECLSLQWLRYGLGYDARNDVTSLESAYQHYSKSNHDMRELVVAVVRSDAFRHRVVPPVD